MRYPVFALLLFAASTGELHAQTVSNFNTLTPCRIADTRDPRYANGNLGPPFMPAHSTRDFAVLSSSCGIPSNALAYSLNITVVPHGPLLYLSVWPTGQPQPVVSTLNSLSGSIVANAALVPAGANGAITLYVHGDTDVLIDINGYFTAYVAPTIPPAVTLPTILTQSNTGNNSVAVGANSSSIGTQNTAIGVGALSAASVGNNNAAVGTNALTANSNGSANSAFGANALDSDTSGSNNTALGYAALSSNGLKSGNTAIGSQALQFSINGEYNTAVGFNSLSNLNLVGTSNIALGSNAGSLVTQSNNIEIGNTGAADGSDAGTIRIGTPGLQTTAYLAGVTGTAITTNPLPVYVDGNGKLGTQPSSLRYKEDVHSLEAESDRLLALRPVRFRYKQPAGDGTQPVQYGLIAEEVAAIYPELVVRNAAGQVDGVQYQMLPALLLKQLQKQQQMIATLEERLRALEAHK